MSKTPGWFDGFDESRFAVNGTEIFARFGGAEDKPALLLLHGFPQTHAIWHRVAQALKNDFYLVMPDLRGYGDSEKAPGLADHSNYSKRTMAQDMVELMDLLQTKEFSVVGHDRGGRVAHRLALDHAQAVRKLCLIDIAPTLDMYEMTDMTFARYYYHWFHLIQPAPLPETMIGANTRAYLHAKLGGWGSKGLEPSRFHFVGYQPGIRSPFQVDSFARAYLALRAAQSAVYPEPSRAPVFC